MRAEPHVAAVLQHDDGVIGVANFAGAIDDRLENRCDVGGRGCDHPEDIAAAGLIDQRFGEFAGLGLNLVEQSHVRNSNDGLIGKCLDRLDLPRGEWPQMRLA